MANPETVQSAYYYYDLETTGLDVRTERIIEISIQNGDRTLTSLINTKHRISPDAQKVHGITTEMLKDQPTFEEFIPKLCSFITQPVDVPVFLIAHNGNRFDHPLLLNEFCRAGHPLPTNIMFADSLVAFGEVGGFPPGRRTLSHIFNTLCGELPEEKKAHRAAADVWMMTQAVSSMTGGEVASMKYNENIMKQGIANSKKFSRLIKATFENAKVATAKPET